LAEYVGARQLLKLATISSSCLRSARHTRRHPAMPHPVSRNTAFRRPVRFSEKRPPHAADQFGVRSSSRPNRTIRTDSSNQPRCLPKSPISSSSSRSAGARMPAVRFTIFPVGGRSEEEEEIWWWCDWGNWTFTRREVDAMR
jgi:hypothetical protein